MKKHLKSSLVILLLIFGFFLRFYHLESRTAFDADQEWLATRAASVLKGDFALLGPVTSVGSFSIGPGFVYLWTFMNLFVRNDPIAGAILSVILGMVSIIALFFFVKKYVDEKTSYLVLFLTVISTNLIFWNQLPWAPSLFYLSQILLLSGAYISLSKNIGYPMMALGLAMGFQSHFGIFLSVIPIIIFLFLVKPAKPNFKTILLTLVIIFVGFLPNFIFDISHNFVNINRISSILKGDGIDYYVSFGKIINIMSYDTISLIYPKRINLFDNVIVKIIFTLVIVNGLRLLRDKKFRKLSFLLLITTIIPPLLFFLQQGKFSEYYLMMTVPSLIILLTLLLKEVINKRTIVVLIIVVSAYLNYQIFISRKVPFNLHSKKEISRNIIERGGLDNYGISLTTRFGLQFGFNYIFDYYGIKADIPPKKGETKVFTIVIPEGFEGVNGQIDFDGIGLRWE